MKFRDSLPLLLILLAAPAHAGGINLSWNDCGTHGQSLATFACDTNAGVENLVVSFVAPVPLTQLVGITVVLDVKVNQPVLSSWWELQIPAGCRSGRMFADNNFQTGPYSCADAWNGAALGGVSFTPGYGSPDRLRVRGVAAVAQAVSVDDVTEQYGFRFTISRQKTVGAGSCGGCQDAACLFLAVVQLVQPAGVGDYTLAQPIDNTLVGWQCAAYPVTEGAVCFANCPVPARKPSWGAIKGLYR